MMNKFIHSRVLFLSGDGTPMEFCVRLCEAKEKLTDMIEHGNGIVRPASGPNVIRLVEAGCKVVNSSQEERVVYVQFIFDCIEQNKLLDIADYSIKIESSVVSDISGQENNDDHDDSLLISGELYTMSEDKKLIKFLLDNSDRFLPMSKMMIVKEILKKKLVPRTFRSVYNHVHRFLRNVKNFGLTASEQKLLTEIIGKNHKKNKFKGNPLPLTREDDLKVIEYIIEHRLHLRVRSRNLYNLLAEKKVLDRSPHHMFIHFTRVVLPNLHKYNLPNHYITLLNTTRRRLPMKTGTVSKNKRKIESTDDSDTEGHISMSNSSNGDEPKTRVKPYNWSSENDEEENGVFDESRTSAKKKSNTLCERHKIRACRIVTKKPNYCEEHLNTDDTNDFLSADNTSKDYKSNKLSAQQAKVVAQDSSSSTFHSNKVTTIQKKAVSDIKQNSKSIKSYCQTKPCHSAHSISTKTSDALKSIASNFDCASKASTKKINTSVYRASKNISVKSTTTIKEPLQAGLTIQSKSTTITKELCPGLSKVGDKNQRIFKFFNIEKYSSLTFPDTMDNMVTFNEPATTETFLIENFTEPSRLEIEESLSITNDETKQLSIFSKEDNSNNCPLNSSKTKSNMDNDLNIQSPSIDSSEMQPNMTEKEEQEIINGQNIDMESAFNDEADETVDIICPTAESVPETLDLGEYSQTLDSQTLDTGRLDGDPSVSPNEIFFAEAISVLKKMENIIVNMDASEEKNNLENNINELYFSLYRQRFKDNIRSIMKKNKLSVTDKAVLLKYIAYTKNKEPQDVIYDLEGR